VQVVPVAVASFRSVTWITALHAGDTIRGNNANRVSERIEDDMFDSSADDTMRVAAAPV